MDVARSSNFQDVANASILAEVDDVGCRVEVDVLFGLVGVIVSKD